MEEFSNWDIVSIISLLGVLATGIWGGIKDHKRRKGQGGTRQSFRPEPFDKRLEDKY